MGIKKYAKERNVNLYELFEVWGQALRIRPSEMTKADVDRFIVERAQENWFTPAARVAGGGELNKGE